ncbi:MAG: immunoglobulin domain-containing protein [Verrucomicrobiota bacterium]|nr:immunoglobulin domain-containing protein [Limisphaera sp.]MDW8381923.1 immunoglobulin domain-containing protein [Verrucomicrobiota bacterium]
MGRTWSGAGSRAWRLGLVLSALAVFHASAVLMRTSQMVGFGSGNLGAVGQSEGWSGSTTNVVVTAGSGSLDGTALGLVPSAGDKAEISATPSTTTYNLFAPVASVFPANRTTNVYYSFLYRFHNAADVDPAGEPIVQINRQNSGSAYTVRAYARAVGQQLQIGVGKTNGTVAWAATWIPVNQTVFVVIRHRIIAGGEDLVDLWVNPALNTMGLPEDSVPAPHATATDGLEDTSNTGPGRFYLVSGANASFDEFRVATTWAEVTPSPLLCAPPVITEQPTNVIITAGVNATLTVAAEGTAPTFQWQISRDGGVTWANVTNGWGMTTPVYITPNLHMADNGVRYRCIVTVSCASQSVTSAVAIVTVRAPVPTAPGLVVHDTWADMDRTTGPVTRSNSLWFASSSGSLQFLDGLLYGMPATGSSRLWIGYFTDDTVTNLPVHLEIGRAIKATWRWNSTQIVPSGGNLRVGLFDYADGGIRVSGDNFGTGSAGNGLNVRGYMAAIDYAQTFGSEPIVLRARTALGSANLMGSTADYSPGLATGPAEAVGQAAFRDLVNYTLEFLVRRIALNEVELTLSITDGTNTWSVTGRDPVYAYHRFDAFAIRPNSQETTAFDFQFIEFKVEVLEAEVPQPIPLRFGRQGNNLVLSWDNPRFLLQTAPAVTGPWTNLPSAVSPYTHPVGSAATYFRLVAP